MFLCLCQFLIDVFSYDTAEAEGQSYRLQIINVIQNILVEEKEERASLSKKYQWAVKIVDDIDVALIGTTMGLGIGGLGL